MSEQLQELEQQLRDKERVVAALTERLEQAAEQLERFRRTGADRGLRNSGGLPPELIENHEKLVEGMQNAVEQWDKAQAVMTLRRIEMRIEDLQESLANGIPPVSVSVGEYPGSVGEYPGLDSGTYVPTEEQSGSWQNIKEQLTQELSSYEELRGARLSNAPIRLGRAWESGTDSTEQVEDAETESSEEVVEELTNIPAPEIIAAPEAIDIADASPGDLRAAVECRDDYIQNLIKRLRYSELMSGRFHGWKKLESAPEELMQELSALAERYNEQLKLAEVEMAVERAKMGRESARLQQVEMQLRKQLDKGGEVVDSGQSESKGDSVKANRRWSRFLGAQKRSE